MNKIEQCQHHGSRRVARYGFAMDEPTRCQERGDEFWHDDLGDAYCPRHQARAERKMELRRQRCAVCGGLNPGDMSHTRCM